jgi:acyl carrier protein
MTAGALPDSFPLSATIVAQRARHTKPEHVMNRAETYTRLLELIEPFNKKGIALAESTSFADDLELDSLTVMDLVANIEDEWDINMPLNILPDLETVGQLADAVVKLKG